MIARCSKVVLKKIMLNLIIMKLRYFKIVFPFFFFLYPIVSYRNRYSNIDSELNVILDSTHLQSQISYQGFVIFTLVSLFSGILLFSLLNDFSSSEKCVLII